MNLSIPVFSLADRVNQLEIVFLTPEQILQFSQCFESRNVSFSEPLFKAWIGFKNATLPTEKQTIENVLTDHTASNVQKKKTNRRINKPSGPARYDPNSPEWEEILLEQSPPPKIQDHQQKRRK